MFLATHLEPLTLPKVGLVGWCTFTAIGYFQVAKKQVMQALSQFMKPFIQ